MNFLEVPFGTVDAFNVVVEISDGSREKYECDSKTGELKLDFLFSESFAWMFNYGFIPQTLGGDGDPLDAIVISTEPIERGTVSSVRTIGMVELLDRGVIDDKILAIPLEDKEHGYIQDLDTLPSEYKSRLEQLFRDIAREKQKTIEVLGWRNKERAIQEITKSLQ